MKRVAALILSAACGLAFLALDTNPSPAQPPCRGEVTIAVGASPPDVTLGQSSTVTWTVEGADECAEVHVRLNGAAVATSGSQKVCPTQNATYNLVVSEKRNGVLRQKTASTQVEVSVPAHVVIDQSTCKPAEVLKRAFADDSPNAEQMVELSCGVAIDLTGQAITINRDYRMLVASPACARGPRTRNEDVPRIFVKDKDAREGALRYLFSIHGDHVLFSGFRLEGPTSGTGEDPFREVGIGAGPGECVPEPPTETNRHPCAIRHVELSNLEIYHWSGAGIAIGDNVARQVRGRLFNTFFVEPASPPGENSLWRPTRDVVGAVHVKGNYIHDNRHDHGEGYGVEVANGGYALIEQNVFNNNRHAIAGGSKNCDGPPGPPEEPNKFKQLDYSGYTVRDNLILPDGGSHCNPAYCDWAGTAAAALFPVYAAPAWAACRELDLECVHTHQIDMHGDENVGPNLGCPDDSCNGEHNWPDFNCSNWLCGRAGETMMIERNTILYTSGHAVEIRGVPVDKAVVDGNVFKHANSGAAIAQNDDCHGHKDHPVLETNNKFDRDPMKDVGRCDFAGYGAGLADAFMVTGVTWWAWSPVTMQWRYLNTMSAPAADSEKGQQLSDLKLGDIDGDGQCDVAQATRAPHGLPNMYSKSGTGSWVPRGLFP